MKYREGDKVEIVDKDSEYFGQKGIVLPIDKFEKTDKFIWISLRLDKGTKVAGRKFTQDQIKLKKSAIRGQEIEPASCCISSLGGKSAHVYLEDCPTKRKFGQYDNRCLCVDTHYLWSPPACEHYKGLKEVVRGGRNVWRVFCDAV